MFGVEVELVKGFVDFGMIGNLLLLLLIVVGLRILLLKHLLLQNWKQPFRLVQFLNRMALTIRLYYWLIGPLRNGGCLLQVIRWIYYIFRRILEMVVHVLLNWLRNGL